MVPDSTRWIPRVSIQVRYRVPRLLHVLWQSSLDLLRYVHFGYRSTDRLGFVSHTSTTHLHYSDPRRRLKTFRRSFTRFHHLCYSLIVSTVIKTSRHGNWTRWSCVAFEPGHHKVPMVGSGPTLCWVPHSSDLPSKFQGPHPQPPWRGLRWLLVSLGRFFRRMNYRRINTTPWFWCIKSYTKNGKRFFFKRTVFFTPHTGVCLRPVDRMKWKIV